MLYKGSVANYMDNFIISGKTEKELKERTVKFLKIAEKHNLCFKWTKCEFNTTEIPILRVKVGNGEVKMEDKKIKAILEWKEPTKLKEVESFIGFTNFYCCFIKNFSHIARPLNELRGKADWKWGDEQQKAFQELKNSITKEPTLVLPQRRELYRVETNTLGYAIGGVLSQQQKDRKWKPVVFLSRTMTPAEHNYKIYNKELLVIMEYLEKWRQYLLDTEEKFEVWTDHKNLKYYREPQKLSGQQARWYLKLQDYDFMIRHIPGKTNTRADLLSRKDQVNVIRDNKNIEMLRQVEIQRTEALVVLLKEDKITQDIQLKDKSNWEKEIYQKLADEKDVTREQDGMVWMDNRIYVPNNKDLWEQILVEHHEPAVLGHPGQKKMLELIKRTYWWPWMKLDVENFV